MEGIPPVPIVTGGMVFRIQGKRGRRWAAVVRLPATADFPPAAHLLPLGLIRRGAPFRRERSERAESPPENHENAPPAATEKSLAKLDFLYLCRKYQI